MSLSIALPALGVGFADIEHRRETKENAIKYVEKINKYDNKTKRYAENIKK